MLYNKEHNRYVDENGNVYRFSKRQNRFIVCSSDNSQGYLRVKTSKTRVMVHRLVWETFNGSIPEGMEIDHINTIKTDNRLENLRCVSHKENSNNELTREHISESRKDKIRSEFGKKFKEHYGSTKLNRTKYLIEYQWYKRHNKCRWE